MRFHKKAFSFPEILITILVISAIITLAVPKMRQIKQRAILVEVITAFNSIAEAEERYFIENIRYTSSWSGLGFEPTDFNGMYFSQNCYTPMEVQRPDGFKYAIACRPTLSLAPKRNSVASWNGYIVVDHKGNIYTTISGLPYPEPPAWLKTWLGYYGIS